ncbi:MAG: hypothetical protein U0163_01745 [Gemmatimonadaceae bacterium]
MTHDARCCRARRFNGDFNAGTPKWISFAHELEVGDGSRPQRLVRRAGLGECRQVRPTFYNPIYITANGGRANMKIGTRTSSQKWKNNVTPQTCGLSSNSRRAYPRLEAGGAALVTF